MPALIKAVERNLDGLFLCGAVDKKVRRPYTPPLISVPSWKASVLRLRRFLLLYRPRSVRAYAALTLFYLGLLCLFLLLPIAVLFDDNDNFSPRNALKEIFSADGVIGVLILLFYVAIVRYWAYLEDWWVTDRSFQPPSRIARVFLLYKAPNFVAFLGQVLTAYYVFDATLRLAFRIREGHVVDRQFATFTGVEYLGAFACHAWSRAQLGGSSRVVSLPLAAFLFFSVYSIVTVRAALGSNNFPGLSWMPAPAGVYIVQNAILPLVWCYLWLAGLRRAVGGHS